ncbi:unnamed protein product [Heterotrigona itama]|uniref:Uncharacterized protein n=1 Tax=Heterotrigona itama TaxID=395501 RepID=A0A6V7HGT9_9HYME|nr:unnamed protein product [Heterotrigona itama]
MYLSNTCALSQSTYVVIGGLGQTDDWLSTIRDSIGTCTRDARTPAPGDTRRSSWRSAQLKRRRAATARLLPPAAALRAYNEANRATDLARGCSPCFGPIRRRSPFSASHPRLLFGGLRGTSTACAYEPQQGSNYVRGSPLSPPSLQPRFPRASVHCASNIIPASTCPNASPPLRVWLRRLIVGDSGRMFNLYNGFCLDGTARRRWSILSSLLEFIVEDFALEFVADDSFRSSAKFIVRG